MSTQIKILETIITDPSFDEQLNTSFLVYNDIRNRISSYHHFIQPLVHWFKNPFIRGYDIVIAGTEDQRALSTEEMLVFIQAHHGQQMSRDNLFNIWKTYPTKIARYVKQSQKDCYLAAIAEPELLPLHQNGGKICPMLLIHLDRTIHQESKIGFIDFDWAWIDDARTKIMNFVFFIPK